MSPDPRSSRPAARQTIRRVPGRAARIVLALVAATTALAAWALASPVGAAPDEPAHLAYAWATVTGQTLTGEHLTSLGPGRVATVVHLPSRLNHVPAPDCYIGQPENPVNRCHPLPPDDDEPLTVRSYMTRYPPLYYAVVGSGLWLGVAAHLPTVVVLYGARLLSAALALALGAAALTLLLRRFPAPAVLLGATLALPATTWFLAAAVNPNGLEVAAAYLLAAAVVALRHDAVAGQRRDAVVVSLRDSRAGTAARAPAVALVVGTTALCWSRPLSFVWAGLVLAVLLLPLPTALPSAPPSALTSAGPDGDRPRRLDWQRCTAAARRAGPLPLALTALALAGSLAWLGYALGVRAGAEGDLPASTERWAALSTPARAALLVLQLGTQVRDQVGVLGWADTPLPDLLLMAWLAVLTLTLLAWLAGGRGRLVPRWAVPVLLALTAAVAVADGLIGSFGWQGRYTLPVVAAVGALVVPGTAAGLRANPGLARAVRPALAVATAVVLAGAGWFLLRNAYGLKVWTVRNVPAAPLPVGRAVWSPPGGWVLIAALLVCCVLAVAALLGLAWPGRAAGAARRRDVAEVAPASADRVGL